MYTHESWINKLPIDVWFVRIGQYLAKIQKKNIAFKVVQMKSLTLFLISNMQSFDIYGRTYLHDLYLIS